MKIFGKWLTRLSDPRVWRIKNNKWFKDNIWGEASAYA